MNMFSIELGIKFGSNEIIICRKGMGIIAKEPAYLAVIENGKKIKVKATGTKAQKLFMSKSSNVTVYQPIVNSEIVDEKMAVVLISQILADVITDKFLLSNLKALVSVPCALNEMQLRKIKTVLMRSGINKVNFVQNSVCARANQDDLDSHSYIMVVDIGKFITDISVLNEYNFHFGRVYYIGGQDMDKSITTFIMDNHNLQVSDMTSEAIKNEVSSLYDRDLYKTEYVAIDEYNKFVKHEISASEVRVAIINTYDKIFKLITDVLAKLPKETIKEVYNNGILFVGGASTIPGLYEYAKKQLDMPIIMSDEPSYMVIEGLGKLLSSDKEFIKINI